MQVRRLLWAKKWLREETLPEEGRTGAGEAMTAIVFGRLSFEKEQGTATAVTIRPSVPRRLG